MHPVQVSGFWMAVYPVTNEQYAHFIAETGQAAPESFGTVGSMTPHSRWWR